MNHIKGKILRFLKNYGMENLIGRNVSPDIFISICIICGIFLTFIFYGMGIRELKNGILIFALGMILPVVILVVSNESDNDKMLKDLRNIFEMLKIQIHAGVYIIDAFENCCEFVQSKRLKKSMNRLLNEIYMSKNALEALDDFNESFRNRHIDSLVIILKQSMESGYSIHNLDSAFEQILDVEKAIHIKMENSVERNVQIIQVLFMAGIIAISVYCSLIEFKGLFKII